MSLKSKDTLIQCLKEQKSQMASPDENVSSGEHRRLSAAWREENETDAEVRRWGMKGGGSKSVSSMGEGAPFSPQCTQLASKYKFLVAGISRNHIGRWPWHTPTSCSCKELVKKQARSCSPPPHPVSVSICLGTFCSSGLLGMIRLWCAALIRFTFVVRGRLEADCSWDLQRQ